MRTISLIRHGRPLIDRTTRIPAKEFGGWLARYEDAGLDAMLPPPKELREALAGCRRVLSSPLRRARESAALLWSGPQRTVEIAVDAREAPLPGRVVFPFAMSPAAYIVLARSLWLVGWARATESKAAVKARARRLADELAGATCATAEADSRHVALVGHGYMNIFTRQALQATGWRCAESQGNGYWSHSVLVKE